MIQYFFANGNEQRGPYSLEQIASFGLRPDTLVWHEGLSEWKRADAVPELLAKMQEVAHTRAAQVAPATPSATPQASPHYSGGATQLNYHVNPPISTDGLAIASFVLGLVALPGLCVYGLGLVPGILAIVFGFIARSRIRRDQTAGAGLALAGLILGFISVGLLLVIFLLFIVIGIFASLN